MRSTSGSEFEHPNFAQCTLLPHWNKILRRGEMLRSKSFGLIWLWADPTKRKQGQAQHRCRAPKSRVGRTERSRGAADSEVEPASNKSRTFQHQPSLAASVLQLHQSLLWVCAELSLLEHHCLPPKKGTASHSLEIKLRLGQQE